MIRIFITWNFKDDICKISLCISLGNKVYCLLRQEEAFVFSPLRYRSIKIFGLKITKYFKHIVAYK